MSAFDPKRTSIGTPSRHRSGPVRCPCLSLGGSMRRRDFIVVLGSAATSSSLWSRKALGQQNSKVHHIGYLGLGPAATSATRVDAFLAGLRDLGYVEGKNLVIEFRWGDNPDQLRKLAAELVLSNVELIFGTSSTEVGAARQATTTIPIVFATIWCKADMACCSAYVGF